MVVSLRWWGRACYAGEWGSGPTPVACLGATPEAFRWAPWDGENHRMGRSRWDGSAAEAVGGRTCCSSQLPPRGTYLTHTLHIACTSYTPPSKHRPKCRLVHASFPIPRTLAKEYQEAGAEGDLSAWLRWLRLAAASQVSLGGCWFRCRCYWSANVREGTEYGQVK